jgi:uncharacterized protein
MQTKLIEILENESVFFNSKIHGIHHWKTVESIGHYLCQFTGADKDVVSYFAYFHDCMRENETKDVEHGLRGAMCAEKYRELISLNDTQFKQLIDACNGHTYGMRPQCITINTCWDADRLDIGRVGLFVRSEFLYSEEAKRIADNKDFSVLKKYKAGLLSLSGKDRL